MPTTDNTNYVELRASIIEKLKLFASDIDSVSKQDSLDLYSEVSKQVYRMLETKVEMPRFWAQALELAGVIVYTKHSEEIEARIIARRPKEPNQNNQTNPLSSEAQNKNAD